MMANKTLHGSLEQCRVRNESGCTCSSDSEVEEEFTVKDDYEIIGYIVKNEAYEYVYYRTLWKNMQLKFCRRTQLSLRSRYFDNIIPNLHAYSIPERVYQRLKDGSQKNDKRKQSQARTVTNIDESDHSYSTILQVDISDSDTVTLQLDKLRSSLVEKLNSLKDSVVKPDDSVPEEVSEVLEGSDSQNEFIIPEPRILVGDFDRIKSKLCDKLVTSADPVKMETTDSDDGGCCLLSLTVQEDRVEPNEVRSEPVVIADSSISVDGGLQLSNMKKALVTKLNMSPTKPVNVATCLPESADKTSGNDVEDESRELGDRHEQAVILERLQAGIRDKMQNEIWVDSLVALVSSLPENQRKTVLDRVKEKLSISDVEKSREPACNSEEGSSTEVNHHQNIEVTDLSLSDIPTEKTGATAKQIPVIVISADTTSSTRQAQKPAVQACRANRKHKLQCDVADKSPQMKKTYGKVFFCHDCSFASKSKERIITHTATHSVFSCVHCQQTFHQKKHLDSHLKSHTDFQKFTCALCDYRAISKINLLTHLTKHIVKRNFTCEFCGKFFASDCSLLNHIKRHHMESDMIRCNLCPFQTPSKGILRQHQGIKHSQWKSFKCPICKETITQRTSFMLHMKKHTGERQAQCKRCNGAFPTTELFEDHKEVKAVKYACKYCKRKLDTACLLRIHQEVHKEPNLLHCSYCTFSCETQKAMLEHVDDVHLAQEP